MSSISDLNEIDDLTDSDLMLIYNSRSGVNRRASMRTLEDYFSKKASESVRYVEVPRRSAEFSVAGGAGERLIDWYNENHAAATERTPRAFNGSTILSNTATDIMFEIPPDATFSHINLWLSVTVSIGFNVALVSIKKNGAVLEHNGRLIERPTYRYVSGVFEVVFSEKHIPVSSGDQFSLAVTSPGTLEGYVLASNGHTNPTTENAPADVVRVEEVYL